MSESLTAMAITDTGRIQVPVCPRNQSSDLGWNKLALDEQKRAIEHPREITAIFWGKADLYTMMPKRTFEEATGIKLEKGKEYNVHFMVVGMGESWTRHTETDFASNQDTFRLNYSRMNAVRLESSRAYRVAIDYVTDKQRLTVTSWGKQQLQITETGLQNMRINDTGNKLHGKNLVVEIGVKNLSSGESGIDRYFGGLAYVSNYRRYKVLLHLRGNKALKPGDVLEIQYVKRLTVEEFAEAFNGHRAKNLENVTLGFGEESLVMRVAGRETRLLNPRLGYFKLQAFLKAELEVGRAIRFWFDGASTRMSLLGSNYRVSSVNPRNSILEITYLWGGYRPAIFRLGIDKIDIGPFSEDFRLLLGPQSEGDAYTFRISERFREFANSRLTPSSREINYRYDKGEISEGIQRHLLRMLGEWVEVEYHPFDKVWRTHECKKRGPDSVQRSKSTGKLAYFEFRWGNNPKWAYHELRIEALSDLEKWPKYKGEPVETACVGILEWSMMRSTLNFYIRKVTQEIEDSRWGHYAEAPQLEAGNLHA